MGPAVSLVRVFVLTPAAILATVVSVAMPVQQVKPASMGPAVSLATAFVLIPAAILATVEAARILVH